MIAADADAVGENLRRHVAIAEMPCDAREMVRVACGDFRNRFARRDHAHDAAVFELQPVAVVQHRGFREIEQKHRILRAAHGDAAAMTAVMWQFDTVGFARAVPVTGWENFRGADHILLLTLPRHARPGAGHPRLQNG
jgi:hypothetical protein